MPPGRLALRRPVEERAEDVLTVVPRHEHRLDAQRAQPGDEVRQPRLVPLPPSTRLPFPSRTARTRPSGPTSGRTSRSTSGNPCSQVGSWITTGTTSQPRSRAHSHVSSGVGSMKSERTKTKLADGTARRWSVRNSNIVVTPSADPSCACRSWSTVASVRRPLAGGHQPTTPSRPSVSSSPIRPRDSATLSSISSSATPAAASLWRNGIPGGHSAIAGRRSTHTTARGASSAKYSRTTNSSVARAADRRPDAPQSIR